MVTPVAGLGSGLDVNDFLGRLLVRERSAQDVLAQRDDSFSTRLSAAGRLSNALADVQASADRLSRPASFARFKATPADENVLSARVTGNASPGSSRLSVSQLAQSQRLVSGSLASVSDPVGSGAASRLRIEFGGTLGSAGADGRFSGATFVPDSARPARTVEIGAGENTLEGIRDAVNRAGAGVTASIESADDGASSRLVIASDETGERRSLRISVEGDATLRGLFGFDPAGNQGLSQTRAAQDARFRVNDGAERRSASNTLDDAVKGVSVSLRRTGETDIEVSRDTAAVAAEISGFVDNVARLESSLADSAQSGGAALAALQNRLRNALEVRVAGDSVRRLEDVGVTRNREGELQVDQARLTQALERDFAGVQRLFSDPGEGVAARVESVANAFGEPSGVFSARVGTLNALVRNLGGAGLADAENQARNQFSGLNALVANLQTSNGVLTARLNLLDQGVRVTDLL